MWVQRYVTRRLSTPSRQHHQRSSRHTVPSYVVCRCICHVMYIATVYHAIRGTVVQISSIFPTGIKSSCECIRWRIAGSRATVQCSKLLPVLVSTVVLHKGPHRDLRPYEYFSSFLTFTCFEMGLRLQQEERSDCY
jgi:hypothetical protein